MRPRSCSLGDHDLVPLSWARPGTPVGLDSRETNGSSVRAAGAKAHHANDPYHTYAVQSPRHIACEKEGCKWRWFASGELETPIQPPMMVGPGPPATPQNETAQPLSGSEIGMTLDMPSSPARFVAVVFPGPVRNTERAMTMLGGTRGVSQQLQASRRQHCEPRAGRCVGPEQISCP